jgi:hypothetical protein
LRLLHGVNKILLFGLLLSLPTFFPYNNLLSQDVQGNEGIRKLKTKSYHVEGTLVMEKKLLINQIQKISLSYITFGVSEEFEKDLKEIAHKTGGNYNKIR